MQRHVLLLLLIEATPVSAVKEGAVRLAPSIIKAPVDDDDGDVDGERQRLAADGLWEGSDEGLHVLKEALSSSRALAFMKHQRQQAGPAPLANPALQIAGMFDSGTNLLGALLEANFGTEKMRELCPGARMTDGYNCHYWKHMPPAALGKMTGAEAYLERDLVVVAVVRSPLAQARGWIKASYSMGRSCLSGITLDDNQIWSEEMVTRPCHLPFNRGQEFDGLPGVWNNYTQKYDSMMTRGRRAIVIEYERLVLYPDPVVREVAAALGMADLGPGPLKTVERSAKVGRSHGRERAIQQIVDREYLNTAPFNNQTVRQWFCAQLDLDAMSRHTVQLPEAVDDATGQTHARPRWTYSDDCAGTGTP